mmetsp:Transcript_23430/g.41145  ORF Transcript_23430/g.41145 Transcript_23430/m.41145 type:complete len:209 (-) Transcript_23430:2320-2946(-)
MTRLSQHHACGRVPQDQVKTDVVHATGGIAGLFRQGVKAGHFDVKSDGNGTFHGCCATCQRRFKNGLHLRIAIPDRVIPPHDVARGQEAVGLRHLEAARHPDGDVLHPHIRQRHQHGRDLRLGRRLHDRRQWCHLKRRVPRCYVRVGTGRNKATESKQKNQFEAFHISLRSAQLICALVLSKPMCLPNKANFRQIWFKAAMLSGHFPP